VNPRQAGGCGAHALAFGAEDPSQPAFERGLAQRQTFGRNRTQQRPGKALQFLVQIGDRSQTQLEVPAHAGAQHLGRPGIRAAAVENHLADAESGRAAHDRAHVARVLHAFQKYAVP
jgi:hypothetical protein